MFNRWFENGFDIFHSYDENVLIKPNTALFVPARINLKATIESEKSIKLYRNTMYNIYLGLPALFWNENLISEENKIYVFKTKYCNALDEILSLDHINKIPSKFNAKFVKEVPQKIHELSYKLIGNEKDTIKVLKKFYAFVREHQKVKTPIDKKPLTKLLEEYEREGHFYGDCKQARDFFAGLCNSKSLPTKKICGKSKEPCLHVWADVFVPTNNGYKLFPVDSALGHFGELCANCHLFLEHTPAISSWIPNFIKPREYKLKIEPVC